MLLPILVVNDLRNFPRDVVTAVELDKWGGQLLLTICSSYRDALTL